jgi:hypothetical protein
LASIIKKFIGGDHISKLGIGGSLGEARTEFCFSPEILHCCDFCFGGKRNLFLQKFH